MPIFMRSSSLKRWVLMICCLFNDGMESNGGMICGRKRPGLSQNLSGGKPRGTIVRMAGFTVSYFNVGPSE